MPAPRASGALGATVKARVADEHRAELELRAAELDRPVGYVMRRALEFYLAEWRRTGEEPRHA